jgi:exonuclease III
MLAKDCYLLTDIYRILTEQEISALFNRIRIINIYAPSGSEKRREREEFYNENFKRLLMHSDDNMLLAGDFSCILSPSDCTGTVNVSPALG